MIDATAFDERRKLREEGRHFRALNGDQQEAYLHALTERELEAFSRTWEYTGRDKQQIPECDWTLWIILTGRGWGKTLTGVQWIRYLDAIDPGCIVHVVCPTAGDIRKVWLDGPSGIRAMFSTEELPDDAINYSGIVTLRTGTRILLFSAEEPNRLRGSECAYLICDELAAWQYAEASFSNAEFGLRRGKRP